MREALGQLHGQLEELREDHKQLQVRVCVCVCSMCGDEGLVRHPQGLKPNQEHDRHVSKHDMHLCFELGLNDEVGLCCVLAN